MGLRGPSPANDGPKLAYDIGRPPKPSDLNERAAEIYEAACYQLERAGVLQVVDGAAVRRFAHWLSRWEHNARILTVETEVTVSFKGESMVNPRLTALAKIDTLLAAAEKKLGFSPEDRMRIKGSPPERKSKLDKLRGKK